MNIKKLKFSHFRNYELASFSFDPNNIHVLYGRNAQGKTNILESIFFLSHLRSFRTSKTASLIQHDQESFEIEAEVEKKGRSEDLKIQQEATKKKLYRYGNPVQTASSFVGLVNAILFCPDDLTLFSDSPKERRKFMDIELVKLSKSYTATLSRYQKILKDRNNALKSNPINSLLVETLTQQLIEDQLVLIPQRENFLRELEKKANEILPHFSKNPETLTIRYKSAAQSGPDLKEELEKLYAGSLSKDRIHKNTSVGIHKDDIEFVLNGKVIRHTASQGQKRSVLLVLKLAVARIIKEKTGEYPILLLDDVLSELDSSRRAALIGQLPADMQIFITTTEHVNPAWFDRPARFYTIENGKMKEGIYDIE
ncbi:MAG: DNA replication/repair protein RecF [Erysipelotrichaceae bacterium]|nr:DNA replication/repair protein RecF [Erysipelotrichaceae bacterium]MCF0260113.1 DNA replication/repair protein RecF [Erysipelotrichaceae bacterium]